MRGRRLVGAMAAAGVITGLSVAPSVAVPAAAGHTREAGAPSVAKDLPPAERAGPVVPVAVQDVAATAAGTLDGVDVLKAGPEGWRRLTQLRVQGWEQQPWTEYHCVTGDGRYMAVAFAPSRFANSQPLRLRGAFGAMVDLSTGDSWILPQRVTLAYHTPGCGTDDTAVFMRRPSEQVASSEMLRVSGSRRSVLDVRRSAQDLASAVPLPSGDIAAARGSEVVTVAPSGAVTALTHARGPVYDVRAGAAGVDFLAKEQPASSTVYRWSRRHGLQRLAAGPSSNLHLAGGRRGANHLVGAPTSVTGAIDVVRSSAPPADTSLDGSLTVRNVEVPGVTAAARSALRLDSQARGSSRTSGANVLPEETTTPAAGRTVSHPTPGASAADAQRPRAALAALVATSSPCAVAPLDPGAQIIQPSNEQVEWAANRAVRGELTFTRGPDWQHHGLPSYSPNTLFPRPGLTGAAGKHVPVQVLEGVMAQESNFSQASWHALQGVAADPLISSYYGAIYAADGRIIGMDYSQADCGYGLGQITTHMTTADTTWDATKKRAVATDYTVNAAASVTFLESIWNQLKALGTTVNNADPSGVENWYAVLWAYNSGIQPTGPYNTTGCAPGPTCTFNGRWGLGWTNNPAQNDYNPARKGFLVDGYGDAAHPASWPYQERVLGWAGHAQQDFEDGDFKYAAVAGLTLPLNYFSFCLPVNNCSSASTSTGYCLSADRTTCWWHSTASWTGVTMPENATRYVAGAAEPPDRKNPYPPSCIPSDSPVAGMPGTTALPSAVIVDDVASSATNVTGCASTTTPGSFALSYAADANGLPVAKIDTHQLGVGYRGHIFFTHTVSATRTDPVTVTGTWTPPTTVTGWRHLWVHVPDNGATTFQADYKIFTGTVNRHRVVNQRWNKNSWVDLGIFNFAAGANVKLSNVTYSDYQDGAIDIAWDAIAFTAAAKPVVSYVALGDSYQSGEGDEPYYANSDNGAKTPSHVNACHRSAQAYGPLAFTRMRAASATRTTSNTEFHFLACSGATTASVLGPSTRWGEVPQLSQGWLDENTTRVTIGIGGNDARFADVLHGCIMTLVPCMDPTYRLTLGNGTVDPEPLLTYEPKVIDALGGATGPLQRVYASIKAQAPNAQILVIGYPHVIHALSTGIPGPGCPSLTGPLIQWMSDTTDRLNTVIGTSARAQGATFMDTVVTYLNREACAVNNEWIAPVIGNSQTGSGSATPGSGSFHPKAPGHAAVANSIPLSFIS